MSDDFLGELFGEAYARGSDPDTSHASARFMQGRLATAREYKVLRALKAHPEGLTNHEIVRETGLSWNTASPRIAPLVRKGLVMDTGMRKRGPTNRPCIIWKAIILS